MTLYEVKAIIRPERLDDVVRALHEIPDLPGVTISQVRGVGRRVSRQPGGEREYGESDMIKLEAVVTEVELAGVVGAVERGAHTGRAGDGKVFISEVADCVNIRSGQRGSDAL